MSLPFTGYISSDMKALCCNVGYHPRGPEYFPKEMIVLSYDQVQDLGVFPVDTVRDPRICRLWSKYEEADLVVPTFKVRNLTMINRIHIFLNKSI